MKLRNGASASGQASPEERRVDNGSKSTKRRHDVMTTRPGRACFDRVSAGDRVRDRSSPPWFASRRRSSANARVLTASNEREAVAFLLAPHQGGLYVECGRLRGTSRAIVAMQFADDASFQRWCEADRLQFTYPLLYANLKRSGFELFSNA